MIIATAIVWSLVAAFIGGTLAGHVIYKRLVTRTLTSWIEARDTSEEARRQLGNARRVMRIAGDVAEEFN